MLVRRRNSSEVGWFGSSIVKKVGGAVKRAGKLVSKVPGVSAITAPINLASDIAKGRNVVRSIGRAGSSVVADARKSLPMAASVVSFVPGVGTAVASGLTAASALSQGKSLGQVAEEAALAAIPGGQLTRAAVKTAGRVARGENVVKAVGREGASYVRSQVPGGQLAQRAISLGERVASGQNVVKSVGREGIQYVRSSGAGGQLAQRAIGAADRIASGQNVLRSVGREGIEYAVSQVPGGPVTTRALNVARQVATGKNVVSAVKNEAISAARQYAPQSIQKELSMFLPKVRPSYGQPRSVSPEMLGRTTSIVGRNRPQFRQQISPRNATASFRPLALQTREMLARALPHMRREVSGLTESGSQWLVQSGDTGEKIALKLTGDKNRWRELIPINPQNMKDKAAVAKYGFPVYLNKAINLPASWIKVNARPAAQSAPAQPSSATPPPVEMPGGNIAAMGQARTILAAWGKSDGLREAGVSDYGSAPELSATSWTARDSLQAGAFANWWRRFGGPPAVPDGNWSDPLAVALNRWAEGKAAQVANSALVAGGAIIPSLPTVMPSPPPVAAPMQAASPAAPAVPASPPNIVLAPAGSTPALISADTVATSPGWPSVATSAQTSPPPAAAPPVAQTATKPEGWSDNQKWGLGATALGVAGSVIVKALFL